MDIEIRKVGGKYAEVTVTYDSVEIKTMLLDEDEAKELAKLFIQAGLDMLD